MLGVVVCEHAQASCRTAVVPVFFVADAVKNPFCRFDRLEPPALRGCERERLLDATAVSVLALEAALEVDGHAHDAHPSTVCRWMRPESGAPVWRKILMHWRHSQFANILSLVLKPQDAVVLLKLVVTGERWTYPSLAESLGMSASEVHAAVARAKQSGLYDEHRRMPNNKALAEFIVHGLRYVFPAERGPLTRGLPTAHAAPPLNGKIHSDEGPPPVWPDPEGTVRGEELRPLYRSVPTAARRDPALYELLALVDAIRAGRARERKLAAAELQARLA